MTRIAQIVVCKSDNPKVAIKITILDQILPQPIYFAFYIPS